MKEIFQIRLFYVLVTSSEAKVNCCFDEWSNWYQSSLTCGQICSYRTRVIIDIKTNFWDAAGSWFSDLEGVTDNCNENHDVCPNDESQIDLCDSIDCREFYYRIV